MRFGRAGERGGAPAEERQGLMRDPSARVLIRLRDHAAVDGNSHRLGPGPTREGRCGDFLQRFARTVPAREYNSSPVTRIGLGSTI